LAPGSVFDTNQPITDTNGGSVAANILVSSGNWMSGALSFGVSNTLWNPTALGAYAGNTLTNALTATNILVGASSSNDVYFGVGTPLGQTAATYSQNVIIENQC
jgi:hypothetical protein